MNVSQDVVNLKYSTKQHSHVFADQDSEEMMENVPYVIRMKWSMMKEFASSVRINIDLTEDNVFAEEDMHLSMENAKDVDQLMELFSIE